MSDWVYETMRARAKCLELESKLAVLQLENEKLQICIDEHSHGAQMLGVVIDELKAENARLKAPVSDEGNWLIHFEDTDVPDEVFTGPGAAHAAMERYRTCSYSWTCHLFYESSARAQAKPDAERMQQ